jgi:UreD urease accessory protein
MYFFDLKYFVFSGCYYIILIVYASISILDLLPDHATFILYFPLHTICNTKKNRIQSFLLPPLSADFPPLVRDQALSYRVYVDLSYCGDQFNMASSSSVRLPAGHGRISVSQHAGKAVFTERSATYPLKLLSPRVPADGVAVVYVLGYGGGLVGGDEVVLSVEILDGAKLVMLTQVCTKLICRRIP